MVSCCRGRHSIRSLRLGDTDSQTDPTYPDSLLAIEICVVAALILIVALQRSVRGLIRPVYIQTA